MTKTRSRCGRHAPRSARGRAHAVAQAQAVPSCFSGSSTSGNLQGRPRRGWHSYAAEPCRRRSLCGRVDVGLSADMSHLVTCHSRGLGGGRFPPPSGGGELGVSPTAASSQRQLHVRPGGGPGLQPRRCREDAYDESESPSRRRVRGLHGDPGLLATGENECLSAQGCEPLA